MESEEPRLPPVRRIAWLFVAASCKTVSVANPLVVIFRERLIGVLGFDGAIGDFEL